MHMRQFTVLIMLVFISCIFTPALAIEYRADFLEPDNPGGWTESLKTFEDGWTLSPSQSASVDIWLDHVPETLITAGFWIQFDNKKIAIASTDIHVYDGTNELTGPWDSGMTQIIPPPNEPAAYMVVCGNLGAVTPDKDKSIIIGKIKLLSTEEGKTEITITTIPGFDTVVGNDGTNYDLDIMPYTITISQGGGTSTTTPSSTTTGPGSTTSTTGPGSTTTTTGQVSTTTTSTSNRWQLVYTQMWAADGDKKLALLRTFRDEVIARSEVGRRYVASIYEHSQEIADILIRNPLLCLETANVIDSLLPGIESFSETKEILLTVSQRELIAAVLDAFETKAGTPLQELIKQVKDDLRRGHVVL